MRFRRASNVLALESARRALTGLGLLTLSLAMLGLERHLAFEATLRVERSMNEQGVFPYMNYPPAGAAVSPTLSFACAVLGLLATAFGLFHLRRSWAVRDSESSAAVSGTQ